MFKYLPILLEKEVKQILKDKSVFLLAFVMPLLLIIIYGYAVRMDIRPVNMCIATGSHSALERNIVSEFYGSDYYNVTLVPTFEEGRQLLDSNKVKVLIYLPENLAKSAQHNDSEIMVYLNAVESQFASIAENYILSTLNVAIAKTNARVFMGRIHNVETRNWFNDANNSTWFLMPGHYVSIITLMAIFLGSFVISREWDRKTMESLATTNASALEIVLSKVLVYFVLALWAMFFTIGLGQLLFNIPIHGSALLLILSMSVYTLEMICLGVLISSLLKNQFLSVQIAVIIGFLPAVLLSGLIFDLRAVESFIQYVAKILPATYQIESLRKIFMTDSNLNNSLLNLVIQLGFTILFFTLAVRQVKKDSKC